MKTALACALAATGLAALPISAVQAQAIKTEPPMYEFSAEEIAEIPMPEMRLSMPGKYSEHLARERPTASNFKPPR